MKGSKEEKGPPEGFRMEYLRVPGGEQAGFLLREMRKTKVMRGGEKRVPLAFRNDRGIGQVSSN